VIINRPLDRPCQLCRIRRRGTRDVPVFWGSGWKNQLMFAAFEWKGRRRSETQSHVAFRRRKRLHRAIKICLRFALLSVYAGWGAGQLESEVSRKPGLCRVPSIAVKLDRLRNLWFDIMRTLGPWYKMLAAAPDDPSSN